MFKTFEGKTPEEIGEDFRAYWEEMGDPVSDDAVEAIVESYRVGREMGMSDDDIAMGIVLTLASILADRMS